MERIGVPPEEFKNRASDGTGLLSSTKTHYLEINAWPPLTVQIGGSDWVPFTAHPIRDKARMRVYAYQ